MWNPFFRRCHWFKRCLFSRQIIYVPTVYWRFVRGRSRSRLLSFFGFHFSPSLDCRTIDVLLPYQRRTLFYICTVWKSCNNSNNFTWKKLTAYLYFMWVGGNDTCYLQSVGCFIFGELWNNLTKWLHGIICNGKQTAQLYANSPRS